MGKGRWQLCAANRNRVGPYSQRLEPENQHGLSEPCAVKSRTHGSSGGKGPQGPCAPHRRRKFSVSDGTGGVGVPHAHLTYPCRKA